MNSEQPHAKTGRLVVVGGGTAGAEAAFASRNAGWSGEIILLSEESYPPYHRPPLSKELLTASSAFVAPDPLKGAPLYDRKNIDLRLNTSVERIDRENRLLQLNADRSLAYDHVILAVGGHARELPMLSGFDRPAPNVHTLRTIGDCTRLRAAFRTGRTLMIVGAGYIGLEVAAAAIESGQRVVLLEAAPRVLARVTAPVVSRFFEREHTDRGVEINTETTIERVSLDPNGAVDRVWTSDGTQYPVDNLIVGVGLAPNVQLARHAGLAVGNGIVVGEDMVTTDPRILAIGDCADFPSTIYDRRMRLESVANAVEHARRAAATLTGAAPKPWQLPWFWSHQYDHSLKIVGLSTGYDETRIIDDPGSRSFAVEYLREGRLVAVDAINHAAAFRSGKQRMSEAVHT
ncbi:NAD(P)/FAD-dependent oxidoreductase [Nocardia callitridis]|uniref:FAD-dependent oxidoreductase n=1 Tax=Nocardia callitridis TaxID=648753 RepID=A0ABP9KG78_9NOCA